MLKVRPGESSMDDVLTSVHPLLLLLLLDEAAQVELESTS